MKNINVRLPDIVGAGYGAFWKSRHRYRVLKGGKASKKSTTAAIWYIYNLMKYPGSNLLVVRGVFNTHLNSTYAQLTRAINYLKVSEHWECLRSPMEIRYKPTGQRILFRGFDDVEKLASVTVGEGHLCWVWIEEAFEIQSEADFNKLDLSVPRGDVPPPLFKQTTLTFNPWSERHWMKKRFFDSPADNVFSATTNYMCNEFLDDTDKAIYEDMKENNPRLYAVAGLGDWGISDGLVYDRWEVTAFQAAELPDPWKYKHVFGLDYGYTNDPTAFIAMAVNPVDKVIYVYDEHYEKRMQNDAIADMIREKGFGKERIRADSAEPKSNDDLRRLGITRIKPATKGPDSLLNGISRLQEYKMIVHPCCVNTISELSAYIWDKGKNDNALNKPVDRDNHLMDAMRYAMEDMKFFVPEPEEERERKRREARRLSRQNGFGTFEEMKGGWEF